MDERASVNLLNSIKTERLLFYRLVLNGYTLHRTFDGCQFASWWENDLIFRRCEHELA